MKISKLLENHDGTAAVEFAIIVPLLILLALGSCEFGLLYYNKQVITNACREGARAGIVRAGSNFSDNATLRDIVKIYCEDRLKGFGGTTITDGDIELSLTEGQRAATGTSTFGTDFSVKVTYIHRFATASFLGVEPTISITSLALMKMEQIP